MPELRIDLIITCTTALSVGAGGSSGSLADKSIQRDGWGRPIIPGSQIKGKVRHAAESILGQLNHAIPAHFDDERQTLIKAIFGSPQQRSHLRFIDLVGLPVGEDREQPKLAAHTLSTIRPSVSVNRRRGTAEDARLFFQETALAELHFSATPAITGMVDDLRYAALVWAALCLCTRWGGGTTRGLGWATVEPKVYLDNQPRTAAALQADLRELLATGGQDAA
jgi:CRISPR/Cas system CSM-associated protein Csm3 (group 7 of RAMP superfamily)